MKFVTSCLVVLLSLSSALGIFFGDDKHHVKVKHVHKKLSIPIYHTSPKIIPYQVKVPVKPTVITVKVPHLVPHHVPYKVPVQVPVPYEVKEPYIVKVPVYVEKHGYGGGHEGGY